MHDKQQAQTLTELMRETIEDLGGNGVYVISVASRLAEMHPNTLRKYENAGLLNPDRTEGRQRLYSNEDIDRLRLIRRLIDRYNLTTQAIRLLVETVRTLEEVEANLNNEPSLAYNPAARKLSYYIRAKLKTVNLG